MEAGSAFKSIQDTVSPPLLAITRTANQIASEDLDFQRSLNPSVASKLDRQNARLLRLAQRALGSSATSSGIVRPQLDDAEDVELNWTGIVDVFDSLLEKADISLDEFSGVLTGKTPSQEQSSTPKSKPRGFNVFRNQNLPKPQLLFEDLPHNNFTGPFRPLLTRKPHAIIPLEESVKPITEEDGTIYYPHPYRTEIEQYQYPPSVHVSSAPIPYEPLDDTEVAFVETPEALETMLEELKTAKEIAIDLEHHDHRSYVGFVSLMQISTRSKDWIVDTLKPWRRQLQILNEVFTDPGILKVLHGSYMDSIWLQRDFGLYVVGMFDTHHAANALGYPGKSLGFLLKRFINFEAQKQYQTADWRIRPLPTELFDYARSDTHFLLYIYDCMRNELIQKSSFHAPENNKIQYVLENSKQYNLQRYENPLYDVEHGDGPGGWYRLLSRTPSLFSKEQFSIFRAVHRWRNDLARELDESTNYLMNNTSLFNVTQLIPTDESSLLSTLQPISPPVRARKNELLSIIAKANADGQNGPEMTDIFKYHKSRREETPRLPAPTSSFAPTLPASATNVNILSTSPIGNSQALRASTSNFWGATFNHQSWDQRRTLATDSVRLALPLPKLTAQIFEDTNATSGDTLVPPETPAQLGGRAEMPYRKAEERGPVAEANEVFTIKQLGGKRKRADPQPPSRSGVDNQADEVTLPYQAATESAQKPAKERWGRKEKKRRKEEKKRASQDAARLVEDDEGELGEAYEAVEKEEEPFDYASAPSVLHAQAGEKSEKGRKKGFNPYAKAMDTPKGLGRAQKERAGRSGTFMN